VQMEVRGRDGPGVEPQRTSSDSICEVSTLRKAKGEAARKCSLKNFCLLSRMVTREISTVEKIGTLIMW
jgi:hypothetical protein